MTGSASEQSKPQRMTIREWLSAGGAIGSVCGGLFVVMDLVLRGGQLTTAESLCLAIAAALIGAGCCAAATVVFLPLLRRVARQWGDRVFLCGMLGIGLQFVMLVFVVRTPGVVALTLPWVLAFLAHRHITKVARIWVVIPSTIGALVVFTILHTLIPRDAVGIITSGVLMAAVGWVLYWLGCKRSAVMTVAILLAAGGVVWLSRSQPAWNIRANPLVVESGMSALDSPNVVLIVLDTTRRDHLGCYGDQRGLTPQLDAFAKEGVIYEQMISAASWTVPSHASMFTGYYPVTHGCGNEQHRWLDGGFLTLAEMLAKEGYHTVSVTNNHYLAPSNLLQGFQQRINPWRRREPLQSSRWIMAAGFPAKWADHGAADSVWALSNWLEHDRDQGHPLFLFVNLMEAHWPHFPPASFRTSWLPKGVGYVGATLTSSRFYGVTWMAGRPHSDLDTQTMRGLYAASIAYQDQELGKLLSTLREHLDLDHTLVMITADHGEGLGEGGRWDHVFALTDTLIRVPMVVRYPSRFPAGTRIDDACQLVDIVPTVFDVLARRCPVTDLPGRSLVPATFQGRSETYSQTSPYYGHLERMEVYTGYKRDVMKYAAHLRSIRTDRYKFVWSSRGHHELYDLAADPNEMTNLVDAMPDVAADFESRVRKWWSAQPAYHPRPTSDSESLDSGSVESLRSLGYVGD